MDFINTILDGGHKVGDVVGGRKIKAVDRVAKTVEFEQEGDLTPRIAALEQIKVLTTERQDWADAAARTVIHEAILSGPVIPTGPNAGQRDSSVALGARVAAAEAEIAVLQGSLPDALDKDIWSEGATLASGLAPRVATLEARPLGGVDGPTVARITALETPPWEQCADFPETAKITRWAKKRIEKLTFEWTIDDGATVQTFTRTNFPTIAGGQWQVGWAEDSFWGGPTDRTILTVAGKTVHIVLTVDLDFSIMIAVGWVNGAALTYGKVRKIKINDEEPVSAGPALKKAIAVVEAKIPAPVDTSPFLRSIQHYGVSLYRTDNGTVTTAAGNQIVLTAARFQVNQGSYTQAGVLVSGRFVAPIASRALVQGKWYNDQANDQRMTLRHSNSAGTTVRDYVVFLSTLARGGTNSIVLNLAAGDRLEWIAGTSVTPWYGQDHTELTVSSLA
jgi:hypothetical protein